MKSKTDIVELMENVAQKSTYLKVSAPMVRYSKVQFRNLIRKYETNLCFSPMIMADSFCQSSKARYNEFSTTINDTPLIVQLAAKDAYDFVDASKLIYPYADGVDLNCGCPQKWAIKDGYGCALLSQPEVIHSLIRNFKNNLPSNFSLSVKIRLMKDLKKSVELCQQLEKCGVSFITIHARTQSQKSSEAIDVDGLIEVHNSIQVPLIANGGIKSLSDANKLYSKVHCSGIMAAGGILTNPALFAGADETPLECVKQWMDIKDKDRDRITFQCYHHHLVFMLEKILNKQQKKIFNYLATFESVDDYLVTNVLQSQCSDSLLYIEEFVNCDFSDSLTVKHAKCLKCSQRQYYCTCQQIYNCSNTQGKSFSSFLDDDTCDLDYMDSNIFDIY